MFWLLCFEKVNDAAHGRIIGVRSRTCTPVCELVRPQVHHQCASSCVCGETKIIKLIWSLRAYVLRERLRWTSVLVIAGRIASVTLEDEMASVQSFDEGVRGFCGSEMTRCAGAVSSSPESTVFQLFL